MVDVQLKITKYPTNSGFDHAYLTTNATRSLEAGGPDMGLSSWTGAHSKLPFRTAACWFCLCHLRDLRSLPQATHNMSTGRREEGRTQALLVLEVFSPLCQGENLSQKPQLPQLFLPSHWPEWACAHCRTNYWQRGTGFCEWLRSIIMHPLGLARLP